MFVEGGGIVSRCVRDPELGTRLRAELLGPCSFPTSFSMHFLVYYPMSLASEQSAA
jgi:hypothetical protein